MKPSGPRTTLLAYVILAWKLRHILSHFLKFSAIQFTNWDDNGTLGHPFLRSLVARKDHGPFFSNLHVYLGSQWKCFDARLTLVFGMTREISLETPKIERDCFDRILHFNSRWSLKIHCKSARHAFVGSPLLLLCLLREYISWLKNRPGISKSMNVRILKSLKAPWISNP